MIVKNESAVIKQCLDSVKPLIDYWVIVDTGSSDDTMEIIRETMRGIPGELHQRPWVHFGHNREEAKRLAKGKGDFLFFIDADEVVQKGSDFQMPHLTEEVYLMYVSEGMHGYTNTRTILAKNRPDIHWKGSMHERLVKENKTPLSADLLLGIRIISDPISGARSTDPKKYLKDAEILEKEIALDPSDERNYFYLAQSYANGGQLEKALRSFQKRAEVEGENPTEKYWSLFMIGKIHESLDAPEETVVASYERAFAYNPDQVEPLLSLTNYFLKKGNGKKAYEVARRGIQIPRPLVNGYIDESAYTYKMSLLYANAALVCGCRDVAIPIYEKLLIQEGIPETDRENIQKLYQTCSRRALSIAAIFKNEAPYFKEWIEYHKLVGVDHFYLYNNGSTDTFREELAPYIQNGDVTLIDWPDQNKENWKNIVWAWVYTTQVSAYEDAIARAKNTSKWLAIIDIDEFLVPMKSDSLPEVLTRYEKAFPGIEVHWRMFGTSHVEKLPPNKLLIEMLTKKSKIDHPLNRSFKTILQPATYQKFSWPPHQCVYANQLHPYQISPDELVINHYMNRTIDYFLNQKIPSKQRMDNVVYSKEELDGLLSSGNDIEDDPGNIQRFVPQLRARCGFEKKIVYIYPGTWGDLFNAKDPIANRDDCLLPLIEFKKQAEQAGYEIRQTYDLKNLENFHRLIVFDVPKEQLLYLLQYPKEKCVLFLWEPPSVSPSNYSASNHAPFSKIFTWNDTLVDNATYFKFHYPVLKPRIQKQVPFREKQLATLIACNKGSSHPKELYTTRRNLIQYFSKKPGGLFSLYGRGWPNNTPNYKGPIFRKIDHLPNYRFCFTYENIQDVPGYITEKIFEAFQSNTVPIYLGASNIYSYIPEGCFIDARRFNTHDELLTYLQNMDEKTYNKHLSAIRFFLESPQAEPFSQKRFVQLMMNLL